MTRGFILPARTAARLFKVAAITAPVHNDAEIETVITSLGREPRGGPRPDAGSFYAGL